jgi:hypothetical protein
MSFVAGTILGFCCNYLLVALFFDQWYLLYFFLFFVLIAVMVTQGLYFNTQKLVYFSLASGVVFFLLTYCDEWIYQILVDYDKENLWVFLPSDILYPLSVFHLFILYLLGYNRAKII